MLFERRVRLSEVREDLEGPLDEVLHAALDVDPSRRPQTAGEFAELLERADVVVGSEEGVRELLSILARA